jgi:hypothetical protein
MVLDCLPKDIYDYLGHDGSEIIWPDLPDPYKRRAFHIQEMVDFCIENLVYPIEITQDCRYTPPNIEEPLFDPYKEKALDRLAYYLMLRPCVLLGSRTNGKPHAVAWSYKEQLIYDPTGYKYQLEQFKIKSCQIIF